MMESETRKELKILLENSSEKIKVFNFLTKYGFFIHHPSRFINSFYFDNNFIDHKLSIEGLTPRKKIRLRIYGNSKSFLIKNCNLEKKITTSTGKKKIVSNWETLDKRKEKLGDLNFFKKQIENKIISPTIGISYYRQYYINNASVRCTLDTRIFYLNFAVTSSEIKVLSIINREKNEVFELKSDSKANDYIEKLDLHWQRFSKYSNGISKFS